MIYREKTKRSAKFIDSDNNVSFIERVSVTSGAFDETWLQNLIADNPDLLPTEEVGYQYSDLVCIGREVKVGEGESKGRIDNLYVTPYGNVVIVETKLFRNQESRRQVVAQIVDYAKDVHLWDAEKLDNICSDYYYEKTGKAYKIIDVMAEKGYKTFSDEGELTDSINKCLSSSSFLLMIVGDQIRSNVEKLSTFLNENLSMNFNLALVELEFYSKDNGMIVIPNLLTKTTVIERTYLVDSKSATFSTEDNLIQKSDEKKTYISKPVLSKKDFVSRFAQNGGYDEDDLLELINDVESLSGVTINLYPTELKIRADKISSVPVDIVIFTIGNDNAILYYKPARTKECVKKAGGSLADTDSLLENLYQFVWEEKCRGNTENSWHILSLDKIYNNKEKFLRILEEFCTSYFQ